MTREQDYFIGDGTVEFYSPLCNTCVHRTSPTTCEAYPRGILNGILTGQLDHRKPLTGDGGIRYKKVVESDR